MAGTRAVLREDTSDRRGRVSVRSGDAAQAGWGPRATGGAAAEGGMITGDGHTSCSGVAAWSDPALSSSRCMIDIEAGVGSASLAHTGVVRGEKITHVPTFPCDPYRQNTARVF